MTAATDMVERVARAICFPVYRNMMPHLSAETVAGYVEINWTNHIDQARAAIAAMREPTEGMVEAYCRKHQELGFTAWANASTVLPAMIDAALGTEP